MSLRRLFSNAHRRSSTRADAGAPVVELDRWQLTGLLLGVLVIAVGAFLVGHHAGTKASAPGPESTPVAALARALPASASSRERQIALAEVWPPTGGIDSALSRPITPPLPSDPTERARAQAHVQLQEARSIGLRDVTPPAPADVTPPTVAPGVEAGGGYTLQVSLFDAQAAAQAIAAQLESAGTAVRVRQVRSADGRDLFRVEVGDFRTTEAALTFQRRFERDTGYSVVLVAL